MHDLEEQLRAKLEMSEAELSRFAAALRRRLDGEKTQVKGLLRRGRWRRWSVGATIATAACLLAVIGSWQLSRGPRTPSAPGQPAPGPAVPESPMTLADGCRITPLSEVNYQAVSPSRVRLRSGKLYVEVNPARAGAQPFVIETPAGEARAVGTRFVVETESKKADPEDPQQQGESKVSKNVVRFFTQVVVLAGVVQLVGADVRLEGRSGQVLAAEAQKPQAVAPSSVSVTISRGDVSYFLPGGLQHESVQDELGLTSAQKQKLLEIARSAAEEMQARQKAAWEKRRQMTPAEEIKFNREMSDRLGKQNEEVRKQVEQVLQPGQVERLKHIEFRQQAFAILKWTDVLNQFGPDQQQKEQLQSLRKAMYAEMRQLEDQNQDKVWGLLTAEQQEKAKDVGQRTILERMLWGDVTRCLAYNESVQNKLGLTPEQEQKFKEIAAKSRVLEVDLVKRLPTMKREEIRRSYVTSGEPIMRQVLEVFQPQQVERFKVWVLREWPFILFNPEVLDQIGLSEQQKEQIAKSRDELRAKLNQVQAAGEEKLLAVLTAQQVEKLKERLKK